MYVCIEHLDTWWAFGVFVLVSRSPGKKFLTWTMTKTIRKQRETHIIGWMMRRSLLIPDILFRINNKTFIGNLGRYSSVMLFPNDIFWVCKRHREWPRTKKCSDQSLCRSEDVISKTSCQCKSDIPPPIRFFRIYFAFFLKNYSCFVFWHAMGVSEDQRLASADQISLSHAVQSSSNFGTG